MTHHFPTHGPISIVVELSPDQAWAFAQFVKRAGYSGYRALAADDAEAWDMQAAGTAIRDALAEQGYSPR